jgi:hypothetical protein
MYRQLERMDEYRQLIRATEDYLARLPAGLRDGYLLQPVAQLNVLEGRPEKAVELIQNAPGDFIWDWALIRDDPMLDSVNKDPRVKKALADIERKMAEQLASLRASNLVEEPRVTK